MEFPDYLKEFENDLQKYKLDYIKIKAKPLKKSKSLELTQSKFLGKPYFPVSMEYPKDEAGKPMVLLAQLNFSEIPKLEHYPESGILQFYVSSDGWYDNESIVIYHKTKHNQFRF